MPVTVDISKETIMGYLPGKESAPRSRKQPLLIGFLVGVIVIAIAAISILATLLVVGGSDGATDSQTLPTATSAEESPTPNSPQPEVTATPDAPLFESNPFKYAVLACGATRVGAPEAVATLGDNDTSMTIVVDMNYREHPDAWDTEEYGLNGEMEAGCLFGALGTPSAVKERMGGTREVDGTREASWGSIDATWTYTSEQELRVVLSLIP